MSFLFPLGLLGLIGVPILIIIYIIKNKYTEQTVTSTYIWTLSEKFLKRKNPINRLYNLISLILQIIAVICISVSIAHPVFSLPGRANDYCFILDGSGSMAIENEGVTRFDRSKNKIEEIIRESSNGSTYTLICSGETSVVVYQGIQDSDRAIELLRDAEISEGNSDITVSLADAQKLFDTNASIKTYFFTDRDYETSSNIEIVNMALSESNYAILSASCEYNGSDLIVSGKLIGFGSDGTLSVSVYSDSNELIGTINVSVTGVADAIDVSLKHDDLIKSVDDLATDYSIVCAGITDYQSVRVVIENEDALVKDNEYVVYNVKHDTSFTTLIVSDAPFFLESALHSLGHRQITVMTPTEYEKQGTLNYGLFIFDCYSPTRMPENGAVWFIAPNYVPDSGFTYQSDSGDYAKYQLGYSSSSASIVKKLLNGLDQNEEMWISKYNKYSTNRDFITVLSCEGTPVLFVGSNMYGNREVVFGFDIHHSDSSLTYNYLPIFNNLLSYTFPSILDDATYFAGDTAKINVIPGCTSICVTTPSGADEYLNTETAESEYTLSEVGLYRVVAKMGEAGAERTLYMYSQNPYTESVIHATDADLSIIGTAENNNRDGIYEDLIVIIIILAVVFIADWMVYCYEQYQLR